MFVTIALVAGAQHMSAQAQNNISLLTKTSLAESIAFMRGWKALL